MSKLPFQNEQDIAEAEKAIRAVNPDTAAVVSTVRAFAILDKPGSLTASLADGSQWAIDGAAARQLTNEEIAAQKKMVQDYLS